MKRVIFFLFLMGIFFQVTSQNWVGYRSPRSAGMAHSGMMENNIWSAFSNPAGLAQIKTTIVGAGVNNRFLMKEFSNKALAISSEVPGGVMAVAGSYFGDASYSEQRYNLAFAKQLNRNFWTGISLDYCRLTQGGGYGSAGAFTFSAGLLTRLNDQIFFGAYAFNPLKMKAGGQVQAVIPTWMRLGLAYIFSQELKLETELEKANNQTATLSLGAEYIIRQNIFFRVGVNTLPGSWSFGVGLRLARLRFDMATEIHPTLGLCPNAGILYELKTNE